jgi:hypothetical protein
MKIEVNDKSIWYIIEGENPIFGELHPNTIFEYDGTVLTFKSEEIWKKHLESRNIKDPFEDAFPKRDIEEENEAK